MKKFGIYSMALLMLGIGTLNSGCMGSFSMTTKLYKWNESAVGNKFVDNLIFWVFLIIPVYGISLFIDVVILNLIEFWSGSNPLSMEPGQVEKGIVKGQDGNDYEMTVTQNRYDIVALTGANKGEKTSMFYTPETKTWSATKKGVTKPIATIHDDINKVEVFGTDGSVKLMDMGTIASQGFLSTSY
jgi:hypothetical protein